MKPRKQMTAPARPKSAREPVTLDDHAWLAMEIIYDAPRTAAYDLMWRNIIERALDRLDAKARAA